MKQKPEDIPELSGINKREEKDLNILFKRVYESLCYKANFFVRNEEEAKEIANTVIEKFFKSNTQFNNVEHAENYLFQHLTWACRDYFKKLPASQKKQPPITYVEDLPDNTLVKKLLITKPSNLNFLRLFIKK